MKRLAIYSAMFGTRDTAKVIPKGDFDYFLYTDQDVTLDGGTIIRVPPPCSGPKRSSGMYKTLIPKEVEQYPISLWLDSSIQLKTTVGMESHLDGADIAVFPHHERTCIYDEAVVCQISGRDHVTIIAAQMERYRVEKYPVHYGLVGSGGLLRRHTDVVRKFNLAWWYEIARGSQRDQLSFNYVCWKLGVKYKEMNPGTIWENQWWKYIGHSGPEIIS